MLWIAPLQLIIATGLVYAEVGWCAFGGALTLLVVLFYTCNYFILPFIPTSSCSNIKVFFT